MSPFRPLAVVLVLGSIAVQGAVPPAPTTAPAGPATAPTTRALETVMLELGQPIQEMFNHMSARFGLMIVKPKPVDAIVLQTQALPQTLDSALAVLESTLEPQGFGLIKKVMDGQIVLHILTLAEVRRADMLESPVTFGVLPEKIDDSRPDRLVTHLLPVFNPDLIASMRRTALLDTQISVNTVGGLQIGYTLIITGPARNVKQAIIGLTKMDKKPDNQVFVRWYTFKSLGAIEIVNTLNETLTGTGVRAAADRRTNTVILSGPESQVLQTLADLMVMDSLAGVRTPDRPPGTAPAEPITPPGDAAPPLPGRQSGMLLDETRKFGQNTRLAGLSEHPPQMTDRET